MNFFKPGDKVKLTDKGIEYIKNLVPLFVFEDFNTLKKVYTVNISSCVIIYLKYNAFKINAVNKYFRLVRSKKVIKCRLP